MYLVRALKEQEEAADDQYQISSRDRISKDGEERRRQTHHPREREEQYHAHHESEREPDETRTRLILFRKTSRQDRDEDDVVNAQDKLEQRKRQERDPNIRVKNPFHRYLNSGYFRQHAEHAAKGQRAKARSNKIYNSVH